MPSTRRLVPLLAALALSAVAVAGCGSSHRTAVVVTPLAAHAHSLHAHAAQRPAQPLVERERMPARLPATLAAGTVRLPVLMYHRIDRLTAALPEITRRLTVGPADFAAQMRWLKANGFHAVTEQQAYDALEHHRPLPPRPVMITFDDGYRDVLWKAAPTLHRLGMAATAFIITDRVSGPDPSFLTWPELRLLERLGVEIGSHTVDHADLTTLDDAQVAHELSASRAALQHDLGHPVQWFAYPAGREDARVVALARQAGYLLAFTTQPGADQSAGAPLELHRFEVLDSTGVRGVAALLGD
jgi:peptidoglycan/xylan/chitin deacetylase (PgdA/CDA1 family)